MWRKLLTFLRSIFDKSERKTGEKQGDNPFIREIRPILEEILRQQGKSYREFRPVLIDRRVTEEDEVWFPFPRDEEMELLLEQITPKLNYLTVVTERPEYFYVWRDKLYQEEGLLVTVCEKQDFARLSGYNAVLDLEQNGEMYPQGLQENMTYIPFYKRPWKTGKNIDIEVPIGYNIRIVERNWLAENEMCLSVDEE